MKKRINISIDTDIHERAQRHAFRRGISLSNFIETELVQKRCPVVSFGPSSKTCPKWESPVLDLTSVRFMLKAVSVS